MHRISITLYYGITVNLSCIANNAPQTKWPQAYRLHIIIASVNTSSARLTLIVVIVLVGGPKRPVPFLLVVIHDVYSLTVAYISHSLSLITAGRNNKLL